MPADAPSPDLATPAERARPMRADAQRNRDRILLAAEEVFARDGVAVPVDAVAERAGVGVGTVYRHFPTKEALFEAIVLTRLDDLVAAAAEPAGDPTDAFFAFLAQVGEQVALKHDLFDALADAGVDVQSRCAGKVDMLKAHVEKLHRRAIACGGVRDDIATSDVMALVVGACHHADSRGTLAATERMLRVVCDGLRASP